MWLDNMLVLSAFISGVESSVRGQAQQGLERLNSHEESFSIEL